MSGGGASGDESDILWVSAIIFTRVLILYWEWGVMVCEGM